MTELSDGGLEYEATNDWGRLPPEVALDDVAAVGVDSADRVYLLTRGAHPVVVLSREGEVLRTWGHGIFTRPHGLHIGPDDSLYCTDDGDHTVRRFTPEGRLLLQVGTPGRPAPFMSGQPFCRCTHTALSPEGDIYVSDGYGNACVHRFDPSGRRLASWGRSGAGPGEFYIPHNLVCDEAGVVHVADRENHRIQRFDGEGRYLDEWRSLHRPCALCTGRGDGRFYVAELGPALEPALSFPNLGPRISVLDAKGRVLARLAAGPAGAEAGRFIAPHGIAVDSRGDIYVVEVSHRGWPMVFPGEPKPERLPVIRKLARQHRSV